VWARRAGSRIHHGGAAYDHQSDRLDLKKSREAVDARASTTMAARATNIENFAMSRIRQVMAGMGQKFRARHPPPREPHRVHPWSARPSLKGKAVENNQYKARKDPRRKQRAGGRGLTFRCHQVLDRDIGDG